MHVQQLLDIPEGPEFKGLFDWHHFNATTLMKNHAATSNVVNILTQFDAIVVHENFAGTGNASLSLFQQFSAMKSLAMKNLKPGFLTATGSVTMCYHLDKQQIITHGPQ